MAGNNKLRKGVKEKKQKALRLKQEAKKLQEHRIKKYIDQLVAEQQAKEAAGEVSEPIETPKNIITPITNADL